MPVEESAETETAQLMRNKMNRPRFFALLCVPSHAAFFNSRKGLVVLFIILLSCVQNQATVWVASPWQRVLRDTAPGPCREVNIQVAANEYEPFRLIIRAGARPLKNVNVTVGPLAAGHAVISAEQVELFRAHYLHIAQPSPGARNPAGWYPDALIPFQAAQQKSDASYIAAPFSVAPGENAEVWCDLYVPPGTAPGVYSGTAVVGSNGVHLETVPIKVTVWDFTLPQDIALRSHFGPLYREAAELMGLQPDTKEFHAMEHLYNQALLKHRAVPATPGSIWPHWDTQRGLVDQGESERIRQLVEQEHFNALDVPLRYQEEPEKCRAYLAAVAAWLRELGYLEKAYVYLEDEPNDAGEYELVRRQGALIHSADSGLARLCTEQTIPSQADWGDLYGAVDIWCPLWGLWDDASAKQRLAKGEQLWSYTALCQGSEATPWWQIDMEPVHFRAPLWISWNLHISGFLYWSSVAYKGHRSLQEVWEAPTYRGHFWGEGVMLYPGAPAGVYGFVPSIRLKLFREAAEDYEYMALAAAKGKREDVDRIVAGVAASFQQWNHDPAAYEQARGRLAKLIVEQR